MGRFSSQNREDPVDIYAILAEREAKAKKKMEGVQKELAVKRGA